METVVNALDARLKELSGQVERRLTETEAKITLELKALDQQDHAVAARPVALEEVGSSANRQLAAVRKSVTGDGGVSCVPRNSKRGDARRREQAPPNWTLMRPTEPAWASRSRRVQAAIDSRLAAAVPCKCAHRTRAAEELRQGGRHASAWRRPGKMDCREERVYPLPPKLAARTLKSGLRRRRLRRTATRYFAGHWQVCQEASGACRGPRPAPVETAPATPEFESPSGR